MSRNRPRVPRGDHRIGLETAVSEELSDLTRLVRSLQRLDGVQDCFRSSRTDCDGIGCVWRPYCLTTGERAPGETRDDTPAEHER